MPPETTAPPHCLVTGATGYIGSRLVPMLLDRGMRIRVLARTPAKLEDAPWRSDVEVVQGDRDVDLGNASAPAPKETRKEGKKA